MSPHHVPPQQEQQSIFHQMEDVLSRMEMDEQQQQQSTVDDIRDVLSRVFVYYEYSDGF